MGRNIRSNIPQSPKILVPQWPYVTDFKKSDASLKQREKEDYDRRHRTRDLPPLPDDTPVWITSSGTPVPGRTVSTANAPRSYVVQTEHGEVRRNRSQLNVNHQPSSTTTDVPRARSPIRTRSRTGVSIMPPERLA